MHPIRLAIDVESGDNGSKVLLSGILLAQRLCKEPFSVFLCGDGQRIRSALKRLGVKNDFERMGLFIEHCSDKVTEKDIPSRVWKVKANSPIIRAITLQKEGRADATISAGDTAILMGAAVFILGRIPGVQRPALAAFLPTTKLKPTLLLDVGANLNSRVEHLVEFGLMGFSYVKKYLGIRQPKVALLNVGKESKKGTQTLYDAGMLLKEKCLGYKGFIEGSGVLVGEADVVVCDGFVGNVLLKASGSFHLLVRSVLAKKAKLAEAFAKNMSVLVPENYGAVPFLGIKGIVLKAHGCSSEYAIAQAISAALTSVKRNALDFTIAINVKGS